MYFSTRSRFGRSSMSFPMRNAMKINLQAAPLPPSSYFPTSPLDSDCHPASRSSDPKFPRLWQYLIDSIAASQMPFAPVQRIKCQTSQTLEHLAFFYCSQCKHTDTTLAHTPTHTRTLTAETHVSKQTDCENR